MRLPGRAETTRFGVSAGLVLAVLCILWVARLLLPLCYPQDFSELRAGEWLYAWWVGLRFDAATVARIFGPVLLLMNIPGAWFARRWFESLAWVCYLLALLFAAFLAGDLIYFGEVHRHVSYEAASLLADRDLLVREAGSRVALLALFALFAAGMFYLWRTLLRWPRVSGRRPGITFLALAAALVTSAWGTILSERSLTVIDAFATGNVAVGKLATNGAFMAIAFVITERKDSANHHFFDLPDALGQVRPAAQVDQQYPILRRLPVQATGRNVVFVLLESWDFKYVDSFAGGTYGATPEFDALARKGRKFTRFFAVGDRSFDGLLGTLTGVPAPRRSYLESLGAYSVTRLGEVARRHGYATILGQSSPSDSLDLDQLAASLGFEEYFGRESMPLRLHYPDPDGACFGWDYETLMYTKDRIDRFNRPFVAYIFTGTTHIPYAPLPAPFSATHSANDEDGYLATLRYSDWSIGEFMRKAASSPWFRNTVFIFTADHTNRLQEGSFAERHHTPMLIYAPELIPAGTDRRVASQLDVLPTLFDVLGFDDPYAAVGNSLFRPAPGEALMISWGGEIGLVSSRAFVTHNLSRRLESSAFVRGVTPGELDGMERQLLSLDQVIFELTRANRWAP